MAVTQDAASSGPECSADMPAKPAAAASSSTARAVRRAPGRDRPGTISAVSRPHRVPTAVHLPAAARWKPASSR